MGKAYAEELQQCICAFKQKISGKGKILDIGCGYGHFIKIMENYGWTASGIEPSSRTIRYAKSKGLNVFETTIEDADIPGKFI